MAKKFTFPTNEEIRAQAYQIFLARACGEGRAEDDWLQAEYELMSLPVHKIAGLDLPQCKQSSRMSLVSLVQVAMVCLG